MTPDPTQAQDEQSLSPSQSTDHPHMTPQQDRRPTLAVTRSVVTLPHACGPLSLPSVAAQPTARAAATWDQPLRGLHTVTTAEERFPMQTL
jgi:hypothetical protein